MDQTQPIPAVVEDQADKKMDIRLNFDVDASPTSASGQRDNTIGRAGREVRRADLERAQWAACALQPAPSPAGLIAKLRAGLG